MKTIRAAVVLTLASACTSSDGGVCDKYAVGETANLRAAVPISTDLSSAHLETCRVASSDGSRVCARGAIAAPGDAKHPLDLERDAGAFTKVYANRLDAGLVGVAWSFFVGQLQDADRYDVRISNGDELLFDAGVPATYQLLEPQGTPHCGEVKVVDVPSANATP